MAKVVRELWPDDRSLDMALMFISDHPRLPFYVAIGAAAEICRESSHLDYNPKTKKIVYRSEGEAMAVYLNEQIQLAGMCGCLDDNTAYRRIKENAPGFSREWKDTHAFIASAA